MRNTPNDRHLPVQLKTLFLFFLLLIFWQIVSLTALPKATLVASDLTVENILKGVNRERVLRNLTALNLDDRLSNAAQYKADDMMNRRYFSHTDPEGNYIWGKIVEAGYSPYLQLGENLAIEFYNTESLINAWMNSPTHRANILNEGFKDQGGGLAFGKPEDGQYYSAIANTFGALAITRPSNAIAPISPPAAQTSPPPVQTSLQTKTPQAQPTPVMPLPVRSAPNEPFRQGEQKLQVGSLAQNFALPQKTGLPATATSSQQPWSETIKPDLSPTSKLSIYKINRYLMMGLAVVLITLLAADLKKLIEEKFHAYDKKINNLVLLFLSLIIIGLMYWL